MDNDICLSSVRHEIVFVIHIILIIMCIGDFASFYYSQAQRSG